MVMCRDLLTQNASMGGSVMMAVIMATMSGGHEWWRDAVVYQVYVRSFADGNGDGIGDIAGLRSRLRYIRSLGVDAIWVNPWYESPLRDGGYDVSDYRSINPLFGTLDEAHMLIKEARDLGLRFLVDLVPNHTSSEHSWFKAALATERGSPERSRYHFLDGRGPNGEDPPNNWRSVFGGPAWTKAGDGQWYLHMFDVTQPDLNWENQEVREEFRNVIRYWLEIGASGFRVDVAHAKVKDPAYPDLPDEKDIHLSATPTAKEHPFWDRPGVHEIVREWRSVLDEYPETVMVAEAWLPGWNRLADYLRPGQYHQVFDFLFLKSIWDPERIRERIDEAIRFSTEVESVPTWVLSNHDVVRHATRYGLPSTVDPQDWLLDGDRTLLDEDAGLRRARAATLLMFALPGSSYIYQGEELGLPEVYDLALEVLDDPTWERSGHTVKGRDGCRVPIPWTRVGDSHGFGSNGSWLPQPKGWGEMSVEAQDGVESSTLELYRKALRIRQRLRSGTCDFRWHQSRDHVLQFGRGKDFLCIVNIGGDAVPLPEGEVLVASSPTDDGSLRCDSTAWIAT